MSRFSDQILLQPKLCSCFLLSRRQAALAGRGRVHSTLLLSLSSMWPLVGVLFFVCSTSGTHNLDVQRPLVVHQNAPTFGFSLAIMPSKSTPWLMVGAPRAFNNQSNILGQSFKCDLQGKCTLLQLHNKLNYSTWESGNSWVENVVDKMMFGFAVGASDSMYVACAPQVGLRARSVQGSNLKMHGACVYGNNDLSSTNTIVPFDDNDRTLKFYAGKHRKYLAYGEAGFSVQVSTAANKTVTHFLIGAPNVLDGLGAVIKFSVTKGKTPDRTNLLIPDTKLTYPTQSSIGLGYSVSSGRYFSKDKTLFATGAPNFNFQGKVVIFDFENKYEGSMLVRHVLNGTTLGEYFGAAIASGDVNHDGLDELMVGAPTFSHADGWDQGRFSVFSFSNDASNPKRQQPPFKGRVTGARFGTAIAFLGDLNADKFGDVAVSAPFEEQGVVYVYYGSALGLTLGYRIVGSTYEASIAAFGYSLAAAADFDNNGYNDVVVGAYKSGHVLVFKSKPLIKLVIELKSDVSALTSLHTNFTVTECVSFKCHRGPHAISLLRTMDMGASVKRIALRTAQENKAVFQEKLQLTDKNKAVCQNYTFLLRENMTDFKNALKISVDYKLANFSQKSNKNSEIVAPMLTKNYSKEVLVTFKQLCGQNQACVADLHVDMHFFDHHQNEMSSFVIGSASSATLKVMVSNNKMAAYDGVVSIKHPSHLHHNPNIGRCKEVDEEEKEGDTEIQCTLINPLAAGKNQSFLVEFESSELVSADAQLLFSARVNSSSELLDTSTPLATTQLQLISIVGVAISGKTEPETIVLEQDNNFELQFNVEKYGPSPVEAVQVLVTLPYADASGKEFLTFHSFKTDVGPCAAIEGQHADADDAAADDDQDSEEREDNERKKRDTKERQQLNKYQQNHTFSINCSDKKMWLCKTLKCVIGPVLQKNGVETIHLNVSADFSTLGSKLGEKTYVQINVLSSVLITQPRNAITPNSARPHQVVVTATFKRHVSKWIKLNPLSISLAIICSLLLLLLLMTGLVKVGFFTRKDKEALLREKLKLRPPIVSLRELQTLNRKSRDELLK